MPLRVGTSMVCPHWQVMIRPACVASTSVVCPHWQGRRYLAFMGRCNRGYLGNSPCDGFRNPSKQSF